MSSGSPNRSFNSVVRSASPKIRGKYGLLALEHARATLYRRYLEGSAVAYVLFAFPQMLLGIGALLFGCLLLKPGDQYAEVQRVDLERDLVLGLLQVVARSRYFGGRDPVGCMNSYQLRQRLGDHCATREERQLSLRECETCAGTGVPATLPNAPARNLDILQIGDVQRIGLVRDRREIAGMFAAFFCSFSVTFRRAILSARFWLIARWTASVSVRRADVGGIFEAPLP